MHVSFKELVIIERRKVMSYIIETTNLTKKFNEKLAVNNINMHVAKGDIYGFIGKNGAGKTSTMKLLLGTSFPTSGSIKLFDNENLDRERVKIGSLIEAPGIYRNFSAYENLKRFSMISGGTEKEIKDLLNLVGLGNVGNKKAGEFSLGMRQRLGIAIAMLGNPELLILDEPINGLDPAGIKEIRDLILRINKERGVTILISSHLLDELSKIVTKYGIINSGVLMEEISADELNNRCRKYLTIKSDNPSKVNKILAENYKELEINFKNDLVYIYNHLEKSAEMNKILVENNIKVSEIHIMQSGFEDYFIERIG